MAKIVQRDSEKYEVQVLRPRQYNEVVFDQDDQHRQVLYNEVAEMIDEFKKMVLREIESGEFFVTMHYPLSVGDINVVIRHEKMLSTNHLESMPEIKATLKFETEDALIPANPPEPRRLS